MKPVIRLVTVLLIVLGPSTLGIATSPIVPWQQYVVHGAVQRAPGLPKENFTCTLAGKIGTAAYQRLRGGIRPVSTPVAITDTSGRFSISVSDGTKYDSLVVMIVLPDCDLYSGSHSPSQLHPSYQNTSRQITPTPPAAQRAEQRARRR